MEFMYWIIFRVVSSGVYRVIVVVIYRKMEKKKVLGVVDNWLDGGIECNVLFIIDGKGGDVFEEFWNCCLIWLEDELLF